MEVNAENRVHLILCPTLPIQVVGDNAITAGDKGCLHQQATRETKYYQVGTSSF